jgi:hypothetical protein
MSTLTTKAPATTDVLQTILEEISVPLPVLTEARARRDLVLTIATQLQAATHRYSSGSVAYGTANSPLEDADGGIRVDRRYDLARDFGPDLGRPEAIMQIFGDYIVDGLRRRGYPRATVDTSGKRAVKFEFHEQVDLDKIGPVDPYVDFILGLRRNDGGQGLWIPNKKLRGGWDLSDPEHHLYVMNRRDPQPLRVLRAHVIRLAKRAIKHDHVPVICSWNICALALNSIDDVERSLPFALADFFADAAIQIAFGPTPDPSPVVEAIALPDGVSHEQAGQRLKQMADHAMAAAQASSAAGGRMHYRNLFGPELDAIATREFKITDRRLAQGLPISAASASAAHRSTRSDGD